jgi:ferritin
MALIPNNVAALLIEQSQNEGIAFRTYMSLHLWANKSGYLGAAQFFHKAWDEELEHEHFFLDLLNDYGDIYPEIRPLPSIKLDPSSLMEAMTIVYDLEVKVAGQLDRLASTAISSGAPLISSALQDMMKGQVDSVSKVADIVAVLRAAGSDPGAILMVDQLLGKMEA